MLRSPMKSRLPTPVALVLSFILAAGFYWLAYSWLSRRQTGKGPWEVEFTTNRLGEPRLVIAQTALGIKGVVVDFPGETFPSTNPPQTVLFAKPRQSTPFGRVVYDDLMFQPGDVALDCFGHVVEMVPMALGINAVAYKWTNDLTYLLQPTNKLSPEVRKKLKGGYKP